MKNRSFPLLALLAFLCNYTPGIYNPEHKDYVKPGFSIDSATVRHNDTTSDSIVKLTLKGNHDINQFKWRLDNGAWSGWGKQDKGYYTLQVSDIDSGPHTLHISVCYSIDSDITDSVFTFYRRGKSGDSLFTITYDGNGTKVGVPPSTRHKSGTQVTVADTGGMKRTGYTFYRWNTRQDGNGEDFVAGEGKITIGDSNITLYARWTPNPYPVIYFGNGNTGGTSPQTVSYPCDTFIAIQKRGSLVKSCSSFVAWNTAAGGGGATYREDSIIKMPPDTLNLYAQWKINQYKITFNKNDSAASGTMAQQTVGCGVTINLNKNAYVKTGWNFAGWATSAGGTVVFTDTADFKATKDTTLYAKWAIKNFTVTFNKNDPGAIGDMLPQMITYGSSVNLTINGFTKTGWAFIGWATSSSGEFIYTNGAKYTMITEGDTLYAKWTIISYPVVYSGNGNTSGNPPPTVSHNYGTVISILPNSGKLIKGSYSFAGWNELPDGSGTNYACGSPFTLGDKPDTFYAKYSNSIVMDNDGNVYTTLTIGTQTWMAENLKTTMLNDGTLIQRISDSTNWIKCAEPAYCWYGNNEVNKSIYGLLYNWHTVGTLKLAPAGWHVASLEEWNTLITNLGGSEGAVTKLKETGTAHWISNPGATNSSGFTALPGGKRSNGSFYSLGLSAYWWTSSTNSSNAIYRELGVELDFDDGVKVDGLSVRCIRD